jgi:hypothetical protein
MSTTAKTAPEGPIGIRNAAASAKKKLPLTSSTRQILRLFRSALHDLAAKIIWGAGSGLPAGHAGKYTDTFRTPLLQDL